jgi:hypothetical protein
MYAFIINKVLSLTDTQRFLTIFLLIFHHPAILFGKFHGQMPTD